MTRIELVLQCGPRGDIRGISSVGHAVRQADFSMACGIVSSALRSFGKVLASRGNLPVRARLDGPGHYELQVGVLPEAAEEWYLGICSLLEQTLRDAHADFPDQINLKFQILEQEI